MPPWKADPSNGPFLGQHPLSDAEIALLAEWAAGGAIEGDSSEAAKADLSRRSGEAAKADGGPLSGWQLGTPDLIVTPPDAYTLQADGTDVFRIFVLPLPVDGVALRARPRVPSGQRDASCITPTSAIDRTRARRARSTRPTPSPATAADRSRRRSIPTGISSAGRRGRWRRCLPKDSRGASSAAPISSSRLHMQPSGKAGAGAAVDRSLLRRRSARANAGDAAARTAEHRHPAGRQHYIDHRFVHAAGRRRGAGACSRTRTTARATSAAMRDAAGRLDAPLIHIKRLGFPLAARLPVRDAVLAAERHDAVDALHATTTRAANARNPSSPPKRARWGQRSADEMGDLWIQVLTRDEPDLRHSDARVPDQGRRRGCDRLRDGDRAAAVGRRAARRCGAAVSRTGSGRSGGRAFSEDARAEAAVWRRRTITLAPRSRSRGKYDEAIDEFQRAIRLEPGTRRRTTIWGTSTSRRKSTTTPSASSPRPCVCSPTRRRHKGISPPRRPRRSAGEWQLGLRYERGPVVAQAFRPADERGPNAPAHHIIPAPHAPSQRERCRPADSSQDSGVLVHRLDLRFLRSPPSQLRHLDDDAAAGSGAVAAGRQRPAGNGAGVHRRRRLHRRRAGRSVRPQAAADGHHPRLQRRHAVIGNGDRHSTLFLARAITGIGVGGEWAVAHALVGETVPPHVRGRYGSYLQSGSAFARFFASMVGNLLAPWIGWRAAFMLSALPALSSSSFDARCRNRTSGCGASSPASPGTSVTWRRSARCSDRRCGRRRCWR